MLIYTVPKDVQQEIMFLLGRNNLNKGTLYCSSEDGIIFCLGCFHYVCKDKLEVPGWYIDQADFMKKSEFLLPDPIISNFRNALEHKLNTGAIVRTPMFFGPLSRVLDFWPESRKYHENLLKHYRNNPIFIFDQKDDLVRYISPSSDAVIRTTKEHAYKRMLALSDNYAMLNTIIRRC